MRKTFERAGWHVFSTIGMDASAVRDIVEQSGLSPGSYYNYFGTKEALFDVILQDLMERIRAAANEARAQADDLEPMLLLSYRAFLDLVLSIDGAAKFVELNQHHIRSRLGSLAATVGLLADLQIDIRRAMNGAIISDSELAMMAAAIFANGTEALFLAQARASYDPAELSRFMTKLMMGGLNAWNGGPDAPS